MTARIIMKLEVESVREEAGSVRVFVFRHPRRPTLPGWVPGAHVDVRLPDGRIRQYSLIGDATDLRRYRVAVKREEGGRGGSDSIHHNLKPGSEVHVSAPRCNFSLAEGGSHHVFVAGGIGITPFLSMTRHAIQNGLSCHLIYCSGLASPPFALELQSLLGDRLQIFSPQGASSRRFNAERDLPSPKPGLHLYACGPDRLTAAIREATADWPQDHVHFEVFQPTLDENFKPEPFDIVIASTGQNVRIPADKSALAVLKEEGFILPSSCEVGVCGSCECGYRDGIAIHRDSILPVQKRQDRILLCVSRARVQITLDL